MSLRISCWNGSSQIQADFRALDEKLIIRDQHSNGYAPIAKLSVAGSGTATFWGVSNGTRTHNESYTDGKAVSLKLCTSSSVNAFCSGTLGGGIT